MAISIDEVKKLAALSRITLSEEELEKMRGEIDAVLGYVATICTTDISEGVAESPHLESTNVMREDALAHAPDAFTEALLSQFPRREGRFLKVKKILEN